MNDEADIDPDDPDADRPTRRYPAIVGNALICSDGTTHQLRLLEKLYVRCGVLTIVELERRHRQAA